MKRELEYGKEAENFVKAVLESVGIECKLNTGTQLSKYDLKCKLGGKWITIEVKYDMMAAKTGNWAIEYYNTRSKKPSGISVTEAILWAHVVLDGDNKTLWMIKTKNLKKFIDNNTPSRKLENVGDGNSAIYLYKEDNIMPAFVRVDNQQDIKKVVKGLLKHDEVS